MRQLLPTKNHHAAKPDSHLHQLTRLVLVTALASTLIACGSGGSSSAPTPTTSTPPPEPPAPPAFATREALGESLFFDENLSLNRTQSCATCHNPDHAFSDNRLDANGQVGAVSLGDDGTSLGDRNTPTATYAAFTPDFGEETHARFNSQQPDYTGFIGGQFLDGRAADLSAQAEGPPVNPIEMGMANKAEVVERLRENSDYIASFESIFGADVFDNIDTTYSAMADAIAAFERTDTFSSFDSKYDRSLTGDYVYEPGSKEAAGRALFFSQQFTNCATCHQLRPNSHREEIFSNFEYHNIGVPVNAAVRAVNNSAPDFIDIGLLNNPAVDDKAQRGKFKVPTLRNVAVTPPYMHNGVFRELATVIKFYDHFLTNSGFTTNPETGAEWADPEVEENLALTELRDGRKMDEADVEAMVCFLRTLTDARYEHLIEDNGIDCGA